MCWVIHVGLFMHIGPTHVLAAVIPHHPETAPLTTPAVHAVHLSAVWWCSVIDGVIVDLCWKGTRRVRRYSQQV